MLTHVIANNIFTEKYKSISPHNVYSFWQILRGLTQPICNLRCAGLIETHSHWLEILLLAPDENPRTPLFVSLPDKRRQATTATLPLLKRIFAIGILVVENCYEKKCSELCERCAFVSIKFTAAVVVKACRILPERRTAMGSAACVGSEKSNSIAIEMNPSFYLALPTIDDTTCVGGVVLDKILHVYR